MRFDGFTCAALRYYLARGHTEGLALSARFLLAEENRVISCNFFLVTSISLWSVQSPFTVEQRRLCFCFSVSSSRQFRGDGWGDSECCLGEARSSEGTWALAESSSASSAEVLSAWEAGLAP